MLFSVEEPCLWDTWPCAVSFPSSLLVICLLFSVVEPSPWDTRPFGEFFSIFSAGLISVVFGCGTLPVRYLALCCFFSIFSLGNLSFVFGCGTFALRLSWPCAFSFPSSMCDIFVWSSVVEVCLRDNCSPCIIFFHLLYAKSFCCPRLLNRNLCCFIFSFYIVSYFNSGSVSNKTKLYLACKQNNSSFCFWIKKIFRLKI